MDNLTVLKGNISKHDHIRIHLAILFHKEEHLILFPWATRSDLHVFLLGGYNFNGGKRVYDFDSQFPDIENGRLIFDMCRQMKNIASALEWLHNGIEHPDGGEHRIHLAHMDLKPDNILIDDDDDDDSSSVGKWVLTDFGISTLKEGADGNVMTIRDVVENFTINTSPQRNPGAYQPPEVQEMGNPNKGNVGRGGDIWSFGCIFAETISFALGRTAAVKSFRQSRKRGHTNDYFYEESYTTPKGIQNNLGSTVTYQVRRGAESWLQNLPQQYAFRNRAVECWVKTLFEILKVKREDRPTATELHSMMRHVAFHTASATEGPQSGIACPLIGNRDLPPVSPIFPLHIHHSEFPRIEVGGISQDKLAEWIVRNIDVI